MKLKTHNFWFMLLLLLPAGACQLTPDEAPTDPAKVVDAYTAERAASQSSGRIFVGTVSGTDAFVAIVSDDTNLVAYVCDSNTISDWFHGSAATSDVTLTANSGATLQLSLNQKTTTGSFTTAGGIAQSFTAIQVTNPAGLYRAEATIDDVAYIGGWIVLANGQQRGAIQAGGEIIASPFMDPETDLAVDVPNIGTLIPQFMDPEIDL